MTGPDLPDPPDPLDQLDREVDVWLLAEPDVPAVAERLGWRRLLAADEVARLLRLRRPGTRRRYLGSRLLRRTALAAITGEDPAALRFETGPFGRPELHGNPHRLRFNVSHTDGLIAGVVTADRPCGIDVESTAVDPDVVRFGVRWLAPAEQARLAALDSQARNAGFVDLWVLKEAYTKAIGLGFQHRFHSFTVTAPASAREPPGPHIVLVDRSRPPGEARRWQFELRGTATGHRLGLAVRRKPTDPPRLTVRYHRFPAEAGAPGTRVRVSRTSTAANPASGRR